MTTTPNVREHIHHSNLIEGFDDSVMDGCGVAAWVYLTSLRSIEPDHVRLTHAMVVATQADPHVRVAPVSPWRGHWRRGWVSVGDHTPPRPDLVPELVHDWCHELDKHLRTPRPLRALDLDVLAEETRRTHVEFERIHPFVDGNGRTGRLLMWWHQWMIGLEPELIRYEDRRAYYDWFRSTTKMTEE